MVELNDISSHIRVLEFEILASTVKNFIVLKDRWTGQVFVRLRNTNYLFV